MGGVFSLHGNDSTAFCQPAFPGSLVLSEYQSSILSMKKCIPEWKALFSSNKASQNNGTSIDDVVLGVDNDAKVMLKTPCKLCFKDEGGAQTLVMPVGLRQIIDQGFFCLKSSFGGRKKKMYPSSFLTLCSTS